MWISHDTKNDEEEEEDNRKTFKRFYHLFKIYTNSAATI